MLATAPRDASPAASWCPSVYAIQDLADRATTSSRWARVTGSVRSTGLALGQADHPLGVKDPVDDAGLELPEALVGTAVFHPPQQVFVDQPGGRREDFVNLAEVHLAEPALPGGVAPPEGHQAACVLVRCDAVTSECFRSA